MLIGIAQIGALIPGVSDLERRSNEAAFAFQTQLKYFRLGGADILTRRGSDVGVR